MLGTSNSAVCLDTPTESVPSTQSYLRLLQQKAENRKLWTERAWRKLLLIPDRWHRSGKSLVDDERFFVSPQGKSDPKKEMLATLAGFMRPQKYIPNASKDEVSPHPRCKFPARFHYLTEQLAIDEEKLPPVQCPMRDKFIGYLEYDRISLVFSNYYMNNPASLFGHTFLRLHRPKPDKKTVSDKGLLDDALNFSAFVPETHPLAYAWKGVTGGFRGKFSLLPYYHKVQEYGNNESRDLWEFELDFNLDQIEHFKRIIWEIGDTHIDYYYLDDNCSFVLLAVLEAIDPTLLLTGDFNIYAIPADTLRAVTKNKKLITDVRYRPSILSRYLARTQALSGREIDLLEDLVDEDRTEIPGTFFADCGQACQARVLDSALDYIDFKEKLWGRKTPETFPKLRRTLLLARAKIPEKPAPVTKTPFSQRPDKGHNGTRLGINIGGEQSWGGFTSVNFRPALHDLRATSPGYSNSMQIGLMDTTVQFDERDQDVFLEKLTLLEIVSLPVDIPLESSIAWRFALGYETFAQCLGSRERCDRYYFQLGIGKSAQLVRPMLGFALFHLDFGFSNEEGQSSHIGPMAMLGVLTDLTESLKWVSTVSIGQSFGRKDIQRLRHETSVAYTFNPKFESRISVKSTMNGLNRMSHGVFGSFYAHF